MPFPLSEFCGLFFLLWLLLPLKFLFWPLKEPLNLVFFENLHVLQVEERPQLGVDYYSLAEVHRVSQPRGAHV